MFIGIDPGIDGAIVALSETEVLFSHKLPKTALETTNLFNTLALDKASCIVLEAISPMPEQALPGVVKSCIRFGWLQALLSDKGLQIIAAQVWQRGLQLTVDVPPDKPLKSMTEKERKRYRARRYAARKSLHLEKAKELFKGAKVTKTNADALLIALWGRDEFAKNN